MHLYKLTAMNNSIYFQLPCILMHPYQLLVCQVYLCWSVLTILMHTHQLTVRVCSIHSQLRCIPVLICTFTALMHPYHWWLGIMVSRIPLLISAYCTHAPVPLMVRYHGPMYTSIDLRLPHSCTRTNWQSVIKACTSSYSIYLCSSVLTVLIRAGGQGLRRTLPLPMYTSVFLYLVYLCTRTYWRSGFTTYTSSSDAYLCWAVLIVFMHLY